MILYLQHAGLPSASAFLQHAGWASAFLQQAGLPSASAFLQHAGLAFGQTGFTQHFAPSLQHSAFSLQHAGLASAFLQQACFSLQQAGFSQHFAPSLQHSAFSLQHAGLAQHSTFSAQQACFLRQHFLAGAASSAMTDNPIKNMATAMMDKLFFIVLSSLLGLCFFLSAG
jgi:hypothetical protein